VGLKTTLFWPVTEDSARNRGSYQPDIINPPLLVTSIVDSPMLYRALIKTHHMTSRKKIKAITKAAKKFNCAVYLKTGQHPPGVMIAESDGEEGVRNWTACIKVDCVHLVSRCSCMAFCENVPSVFAAKPLGHKEL